MFQNMKTVIIRGALLALCVASAFAQYSSPVRDVDNPARQPVHLHSDFMPSVGVWVTTVPANKRLVVEHVYAYCKSAINLVFLNDSAWLVGLQQPVSGSPYLSAPIRLYVDPGNRLGVSASSSDLSQSCTLDVVGYYVNLP